MRTTILLVHSKVKNVFPAFHTRTPENPIFLGHDGASYSTTEFSNCLKITFRSAFKKHTDPFAPNDNHGYHSVMLKKPKD
jgi:hypothetical protein